MKSALSILLIVTVIVGLLVSGVSCTKTVYVQITPTPSPKPISTLKPAPTATIDAVDLCTELVVEPIKKNHPYYMIRCNDYIVVEVFEKLKYSQFDEAFICLTVMNVSSEYIYTSPLYLTVIDNIGGVHDYEAHSYSFWGDKCFSGINLPPDTINSGFLNFRMTSGTRPVKVIYRDGQTPTITMDWISNPDAE